MDTKHVKLSAKSSTSVARVVPVPPQPLPPFSSVPGHQVCDADWAAHPRSRRMPKIDSARFREGSPSVSVQLKLFSNESHQKDLDVIAVLYGSAAFRVVEGRGTFPIQRFNVCVRFIQSLTPWYLLSVQRHGDSCNVPEKYTDRVVSKDLSFSQHCLASVRMLRMHLLDWMLRSDLWIVVVVLCRFTRSK
ncbi:hypothetical protein Anapl_11598 [Anas platyrhynchos]|uniref:Uncharacterized protein n=1 Tax=Anas platyrhynchos TaxID=8839 RepID=R0LA51_ANAPL|nr:hypothetical protein Anapl_11598 [Anas platyrhynchos]